MEARNVSCSALVTLFGCIIGACGGIGEPQSTDNAKVGTSQEALGVYDVGVIPSSTSCPAGAALSEIGMDDEDSHNTNSRWGWLGANVSDSNTLFRFCRVDGTLFAPLSSANVVANHYALLKMGAACPPGSMEFSRSFDNEDDNNKNWHTGDIYPNQSGSNTRLYFCLFRYGPPTMATFPNLGISYGVFAASNFSQSLAAGYMHTDDEDDGNANGYSASSEIVNDAQRIISSGHNTSIGLAQVR